MSTVGADTYFSHSHEWVRVEGDLVRIGISAFAQEQLGDIVYVELPEPGSTLSAGTPFGVVESVKTLSDLNAPISGEVVARNEVVVEQPELVNAEPFAQGWLLTIRPEKLEVELAALLDADAYAAHCADAGH